MSPEEVIERVKEWNFGTREGISPQTRAEREVVYDLLRDIRVKSADARKAVKDPKAGFRAYLELACKAKHGEQPTAKKLAELFETEYPKVVKRAEEIVAEQAAKVTIDL